MSLAKSATVVSYGAYGDAILTTARRSTDALPSDQVLVALLNRTINSSLSQTGMRSVCAERAVSASHSEAAARTADITGAIPEDHTNTMMPVAHITGARFGAELQLVRLTAQDVLFATPPARDVVNCRGRTSPHTGLHVASDTESGFGRSTQAL